MRLGKPLPGAVHVGAVGREGDRLGLELGHHEHGAARIGLGQRLLDPLGQTVGLDRQRSGPVGKPLEGRLPDPVHREDNADDPRGVVDQPLHERQPLAGSDDRQEARRCEPAPGEGSVLDTRGRELVRIVAEPLLPLCEQTGSTQGDAVRDRVGAPRALAGEDRVDRRLGVRLRPPDQLDRSAVA